MARSLRLQRKKPVRLCRTGFLSLELHTRGCHPGTYIQCYAMFLDVSITAEPVSVGGDPRLCQLVAAARPKHIHQCGSSASSRTSSKGSPDDVSQRRARARQSV